MFNRVSDLRSFVGESQDYIEINTSYINMCDDRIIRDEFGLVHKIAMFSIPLYHFIVRPLLHKMTKYTPSMLKLIGIAFLFENLGTIGMVTIETVGHL